MGLEVEPLLDIGKLAERLQIRVHQVRRLVAERRIPHLKIGNRLRFLPEEIDAWLQELAARGVVLDAADPALNRPHRLQRS